MKAATAVIHRRALRHNLQRVREIASHSRIIAVVKANAYGHGLLETAHTVKDLADSFGVARISEAIALRENGISNPILLLEGFLIQRNYLLSLGMQLILLYRVLNNLKL